MAIEWGGMMDQKNFPKGFQGTGLNCSIKKEKRDLAVIFTEFDANVAVVYTNNILKAAPLQITQKHLANQETAKAIIINSGIANAAMGEQGRNDAEAVSIFMAEKYQIAVNDIIVASTGVIGMPLPVKKIQNGILESKALMKPLNESHELIANAIMTTDTVAKESYKNLQINNEIIRFWGIAKGSGMIHPNMSTMLGFICTDANITTPLLQEALLESTNESFNMISVDGDTSTNDMVAVLANGQAGNDEICDKSTEAYQIFKSALKEICQSLAKQIVADGEGATKMFEVQVKGSHSKNDAKMIARAVVSSSLVKAAIFGKDANWGRIACAAGYSGASFDPNQLDIYIDDLIVAKNGQGIIFDETMALEKLSKKEISICIDLHQGNEDATAWGCDLTYDYVTINADYRS